MSQGHRIPLNQARSLAYKIICELRPYCQRLRVAGSIRRHESTVGDIEIVVIPRYEQSLIPELSGPSLLAPALLGLVNMERLVPAYRSAMPEKLIKFYIPSLYGKTNTKLEIVVSSPERWGVELAIKTGPAAFSHKLVTRRDMGGYLPSDCHISGGWQVQRNGGYIPFETERQFIEFCLGKWIPPKERTR